MSNQKSAGLLTLLCYGCESSAVVRAGTQPHFSAAPHLGICLVCSLGRDTVITDEVAIWR